MAKSNAGKTAAAIGLGTALFGGLAAALASSGGGSKSTRPNTAPLKGGRRPTIKRTRGCGR